MAFKQSPSIVVSGAMGIVTGVAIAGGLVFALSLSATAEQQSTTPAHIVQQPVITDTPRAKAEDQQRSARAEDLDLRTFGNSTARSFAMRAEPAMLRGDERGEVVALIDASSAADRPQS